VEIKIISTHGDRTQEWNTAFDKLEGKGFFTKELEEALLKKEIDLAVHSHKDLPTESPDGLMIGAVSDREDPSELLLIRKENVDDKQRFNLKSGAKVGTSSARRKSQLTAFRPDVTIEDLRGNVPTRINKLREGQYDAIMLAAAGIERLGLDLSDLHVEKLDPKEFIPAPAQGVLAWQIRDNDSAIESVIDKLNNEDVQMQINVERRILNLFDGGCQLPLGAYCESEISDQDRLIFRVWVSKAAAFDKQPVQLLFETHYPWRFARESS
jgi:hydroxymethylbilane synthase